ncbi:hypothetical protein C2845_PM05G17340 [Panicum miliaceum]|uniref:Uncharacterized protein n=1 Tax=Panicum miliaceum TaxID=4540 RepID=A0A3L6T3I2_PANMI|nr:hypothetical protein C2845_PM05G17340 [Panicum miliaceum]
MGWRKPHPNTPRVSCGAAPMGSMATAPEGAEQPVPQGAEGAAVLGDDGVVADEEPMMAMTRGKKVGPEESSLPGLPRSKASGGGGKMK